MPKFQIQFRKYLRICEHLHTPAHDFYTFQRTLTLSANFHTGTFLMVVMQLLHLPNYLNTFYMSITPLQ